MSSEPTDHSIHVEQIQSIGAVPQILQTVASITGLRFVAIAHVTDSSWTTCAVLDKLDFGLKVGDGLDVATTLCDEVRSSGKTIVIDHVGASDQYRDHHTPRIYGFQSYFSVPVLRQDGSYFGTLCGLDPEPAQLSAPATISTLELFAELVTSQLESERLHGAAQSALLSERETAELREQFIAVLGHDLRTPLGAFQNGIELLRLKYRDTDALPVLRRMERSVLRMAALVDDVVDFTRGRMGGGIALDLRYQEGLHLVFAQVIDELREIHPEHPIDTAIESDIGLVCDGARLAQLLSNLVKNAIVHGERHAPVQVRVGVGGGELEIAVINRGAALSPQLAAQLFKPFWRRPSTGAHEGLGLGLYIVAEIARSHGGRMEVTSSDGAVCFALRMPASG